MSQHTNPQLTLIVRQGPQPNQAFPVEKDTVTIGRATDNDIVIPEAEVSRHHARLTRQRDSWIVEDLKSRNGTLINGQRISGPVVVAPGSSVSLGPNVLLQAVAGPVPSAPVQAQPPAQPVSQSASTATAAAAPSSSRVNTIWLVVGGVVCVVVLAAIAAGLGYVVLKGPSPDPLASGVTQTDEPAAATEPVSAPDEDALDQLSPLTGPDVAFLEPSPGTELDVGESVLVFATARDPNKVTLVELYVDDYLVVQQGSPDDEGVTPLSLIHNLAAIAPGTHALTVRAYNSLGQTGESPVIYVRAFDQDTLTAQYVVQPGESLAMLAQELGTTEDDIRKANPGLGSSISANQAITVPVPQQPYEPPQPPISPTPTTQAPPQDKPRPGFFGYEPPQRTPQGSFSGGQGVQDRSKPPDDAGGAPAPAKPKDTPPAPQHPDLPTPDPQAMGALLASFKNGQAPGMVPMGSLQDAGGFRGPAIANILDPVSGAQKPLPHSPQNAGMGAIKNLKPPSNKSLPEPKWVEAKAHDCSVTLKWEKQTTTDATHYEIYRMAIPGDAGFTGVPVVTLDARTHPEYEDKVPRPGKYRYKIRAVKRDKGKDKGKVTAVADGAPKTVLVPVSATCVPDAKYKRVYFHPVNLSDKASGPYWYTFFYLSVNRGASMRVPSFPEQVYIHDWRKRKITSSMPAPLSLYVKGADPKTSPDPMLYYEATIGGEPAEAVKKVLEPSSFHSSYPVSQLKADRLHLGLPRDVAKRVLWSLVYKIWVDDVMWTGREQNDKLPAPENLHWPPGTVRTLKWTWPGSHLDVDAFIVYRFYSCPGQPSRLAAPEVVQGKYRSVLIPAHTEFPGCAVRYQVSAYGRKGESPLSSPVDVPATSGTVRVRVTFSKLEFVPKRGKDTLHTQIALYANQYKLGGYVSLKKGVNHLNEFLLGGKTNNNSLLLDMADTGVDQLQLGLVVGSETASIVLSPRKGETWKDFPTTTQVVSLKSGGDDLKLTVVVGGQGATPSDSKLRTADISISDPVACGRGDDPSDICVILQNNGPDRVDAAQVDLSWTWADAHVAPERLSSTCQISRWIAIPVGAQQWVKIIDADEKDPKWGIHKQLEYLEVEYSPGTSGLQDPDAKNNKAWAYVDKGFFSP